MSSSLIPLQSAQGLIEASLDSFVTISAEGKIMDANSAAEEATGFRRQALIGSYFCNYFTEPDRAFVVYKKAFSQGFVKNHLLTIRQPSGKTVDLLYNASVYKDGTGDVAGVFAAGRDVTLLKRSQQEFKRTSRDNALLSQITKLLQSCRSQDEAFLIIKAGVVRLFPGTSGACFLFNEDENLLHAVCEWGDNPPKEKTFAPDDCWGVRRGVYHTRGSARDINPRCKHIAPENGDSYLCLPLLAQRKTFGSISLNTSSCDMDTPEFERGVRLLQSLAENISLSLANLKLRESLHALSLRDPLTGLFNRRFMEETLAREMGRATRTRKEMAVILLDIDHFKDFNDTFGHDAGDEVLKELATLTQGFRQGVDVACRFGGEEFVLILPEISATQAMNRLEQLRQAVSELKVSVQGKLLGRITVSMGVAFYPADGSSINELIKAADNALYQAKREGRNRIVTSLSMISHRSSRQ